MAAVPGEPRQRERAEGLHFGGGRRRKRKQKGAQRVLLDAVRDERRDAFAVGHEGPHLERKHVLRAELFWSGKPEEHISNDMRRLK